MNAVEVGIPKQTAYACRPPWVKPTGDADPSFLKDLKSNL